MNDLVSLNCPNCGSPLKVESTQMKTNCQFCGTEILIKGFITERRIDKEDKLESYMALIENSRKNKDYKNLYKYYKEVCKLEASKENLIYLNIYGYLCCSLNFQFSWLNDMNVLPPEQHRTALNDILKFVVSKKQADINRIPKNLDTKQRRIQVSKINKEYSNLLNSINSEIERMKIRRCKCKAEFESNIDICPNCGTDYNEYQKELFEEKQAKKRKIIKTAIIIGIPVVIIAIVFSFVYNGARGDKIHSSIESGDYAVAEELIDDYVNSNSTSLEPYQLYAELYLAQDNPQEAVDKLEEGLRRVGSSSKDDLQKQIDEINKEYSLQK